MKNEEKEEYKLYTKSSTYNNNCSQVKKVFNYNNLNDNINNNKNKIQKSRTCRENENINRHSFTIRLNNMGRNHLETVLETVNEVSHSIVDSIELSDDDEDERNDENTHKNETKETGKIKEESCNINSESKVKGTNTRINDSDYNEAKKKSLFLSSEKTH